jgi:hypothetical protein
MKPPITWPTWEERQWLGSSVCICDATKAGALPFERSALDLEGSMGAFPFPFTMSVKDGDRVEQGRQLDGGERPSEKEGLNRSHSESSSPLARRLASDGEKGDA